MALGPKDLGHVEDDIIRGAKELEEKADAFLERNFNGKRQFLHYLLERHYNPEDAIDRGILMTVIARYELKWTSVTFIRTAGHVQFLLFQR
jgi:hypothetical protein